MAARPLLAGLTRQLALRAGLTDLQVELLDAEGADGLPPVPDSAGPDLLGLAHEALLAPVDRKRRGAHYTPPALADRLVALTLPDRCDAVLDPACGGGAFLLAAGRALVARGLSAGVAVRALHGVDVDPLAVEVTRAATALWSGGPSAQVTEADFLLLAPDPVAMTTASGARTGGFDAVVGNPPFASPLRGGAGGGPAAYTDLSARFLERSLGVVRPGGRVGLIQPQSVLTARDAAPVRERVPLRALWVAERRVFPAATHVVGVVAERDGPPGPVDLYGGPTVEPRGRSQAAAWGLLAARARGLPEVDLGDGPTIGSVATATAGFRRQFYGLVDHLVDAEEGPARAGPSTGAGVVGSVPDGLSPVVTAGLIDPGRCRWGERSTRIGGRAWQRPAVDVDALPEDLAAWYRARLVPKLLVATQTKVVEVVVDEAGSLLPSVPVISVEAPAESLWDLAAALSAPPVAAWCLARAAGSGLSADAVRLSAKLLRQVPLPVDRAAWTEAAAAFRAGDLEHFAPAACRAYRADEALADWWHSRRPH